MSDDLLGSVPLVFSCEDQTDDLIRQLFDASLPSTQAHTCDQAVVFLNTFCLIVDNVSRESIGGKIVSGSGIDTPELTALVEQMVDANHQVLTGFLRRLNICRRCMW